MAAMTNRAYLLLALSSFLLLPGCGGGCGEEPKESSGPAAGAAPGGASGGSGGGGEVAQPKPGEDAKPGGKVDPSRFDSAKDGGKTGAADQAREASAEKPLEEPKAGLRRIPVGELGNYLKRAQFGRRALVIETKKGCKDCDVARPVIVSLLNEHSQGWDFYDADLGAAELTTSSATLPIFLMYSGVQQTSRLEGMPFPREKGVDGGESSLAYSKRLRRWFQDALTQQSLKFAGR